MTSLSQRVGIKSRIIGFIMVGTVAIVPVVSCTRSSEPDKVETEESVQGWGQPVISVACMREEPRHGAELVSQCLLGDPVGIMGRDGEWLDVMTAEGYRGWVNQSSIAEKSNVEMDAWRAANRYVVDSPTEIRVYATQDLDVTDGVVTDLVDGCIVEGDVTDKENVIAVTLPDGRNGYADASNFMTVEDWSAQSYDTEKIISRAEALQGVPYLWGGLSTKSMDCSGLVKLCYRSCGLIIVRDASQQAKCGEEVDLDGLKRGDLLFFGNPETGRVTHVGIYEGNGMYIHCSGRVRRNSLERESAEYMEKHYLGARRVCGATSDGGVNSAKNHSWYF